jgi:hypothetical protein
MSHVEIGLNDDVRRFDERNRWFLSFRLNSGSDEAEVGLTSDGIVGPDSKSGNRRRTAADIRHREPIIWPYRLGSGRKPQPAMGLNVSDTH